jgi:peptidoglycan/xylan/chitin deacetylase (PgdA/CDA1 family)
VRSERAIPISKRKSAPTFTAKDNFRRHKRGAIVLLHIRQAEGAAALAGCATSGKPKALSRLPELLPRKGLKWKSRKPPQWAEELERKAQFCAAKCAQKMKRQTTQ